MTGRDESAVALDGLCVNTIRFLAVDAVQKANSGHPGLPMAMAPVAHTLFSRHLTFDPADPAWPDRDRFVLSAGHGSMLLYALLHLTGYDLSLDDLKAFRQLGSRTPGHPERGCAPGVETTTGPLGQGLSTAVGMAIAEAFLAATFNREGHAVVDHHTYVLASDGDMMEGVASEACSLAGHLGLGKLVVLYDDNHITIDGPTDLAFSEDVLKRFGAYGWHTQRVTDANDIEALDVALAEAKKDADRPSLVAVRSHIGFGSPNRQDTSRAHGEALGEDEVRLTKENLGWPLEPTFLVPPEVPAAYGAARGRGEAARASWRERLAAWRAAHPDLAATWDRAWRREPAPGWEEALPKFDPADGGVATRSASGAVINAVASFMPTMIGGSADLAPSNNTLIKGADTFAKGSYGGRNLHFGVREHAMAAAANGMAVHGGVIPYAATFFVFTDYNRPALRLGGLMELPVIYVFTHDSIGLGEDGPTHQPVEHLAILRATPNWTVIRPADGNETVVAWKVALEHRGGPVGLILTRQKLPTIDRARYGAAEGVAHGAYVLADPPDGTAPAVVVIATGSEVHLGLDAHERLTAEGAAVRVVNMASRELFLRQDEAYRESVLPAQVTRRLAVEAGVSFGWGDIVGSDGEVLGLDRFGASAPAAELFPYFGFTVDAVCERVRALLKTTVQR
jgi:transketolase